MTLMACISNAFSVGDVLGARREDTHVLMVIQVWGSSRFRRSPLTAMFECKQSARNSYQQVAGNRLFSWRAFRWQFC